MFAFFNEENRNLLKNNNSLKVLMFQKYRLICFRKFNVDNEIFNMNRKYYRVILLQQRLLNYSYRSAFKLKQFRYRMM